MTAEIALLIHELLNPPRDGMSESELDEQAERIQARQDLADSWERATKTGYREPRGQFTPDVPVLPKPDPAPLTPCVHPVPA